MSGPADARRRPAAGKLDPTVRALLRSFLSPAVADTYAAALQPIAVADRDAAIAGAVSALRVRFGVLPEEMAVVLIEDTGWDVIDVATLLGIPVATIRAELQHPDAPRIGPGEEPGELDDSESAEVDAMLAGMPVSRQRFSEALAALAAVDEEDVDVEMSTTLPAHVGIASLEERINRSDRRQRQVVNGAIAAIIVLVGITVDATRVPVTDDTVEVPVGVEDNDPEADAGVDGGPDGVDPDELRDPDDAPVAEPGVAVKVPIGPAQLAEARLVSSVDPATGDAGEPLTETELSTDVRVWLRFDQLPDSDLLVELTFIAPDGSQTVRPVLVPRGLSRVAVRLPAELGREPGRYGVRIEVADQEPVRLEVRLTNPDDALDPGDAPTEEP